MKYNISHIATVLDAIEEIVSDTDIEHLIIDSRRIVFPERSLFFALAGPRRDGHEFIEEVYQRGIRNFVVSKSFDHSGFASANFLKVDDVLLSLQHLAAYHRYQFSYPVIGITGSNGKTIVKEWLYHLLSLDRNIVRSPRSYNSQIGVPLSVWQMNEANTLAILEAGISQPDEMDKLAGIIQPTIGVLTNIGEAHSEGFIDHAQKFSEKFRLFEKCETVIARRKDLLTDQQTLENELQTKLLTWGASSENAFVIEAIEKQDKQTFIKICFQSKQTGITIPFTDDASIENVITCCCVMLVLKYSDDVIAERIKLLQQVEMRLQLKKAVNNSYIINDSYSNDPYSLAIALDYLKQQAGSNKTTVILSDFMQSAQQKTKLYEQVAIEMQQRNIGRLIGIGPQISQNRKLISSVFKGQVLCFSNIEELFDRFTTHQFRDEYILLKGARVFEFERISRWLEQKVHQTVLEVNLTALVYNLKIYQSLLKPSTKMMVMVKAFSYGSGSAEVARVLQFHKVDYLAVAYADEGVELRKEGISLPIMVMNADEVSFDTLVQYNLEPEIYGMHILQNFNEYLNNQGIQQFPVHIKIDTGMHRLGFEPKELDIMCNYIRASRALAVRSVFTHLVGSESPELDEFTQHQVSLFEAACKQIEEATGYSFIKHAGNSSAINRHPHLQFDMVRLGIGLYGVDSSAEIQDQLQTVATLRSTVSQIRNVAAGETVGYNRKGVVTRESKIATVRIGYADGLTRYLGNGNGKMFLKGGLAPIIGNVCMDMTMIDVTDVDASIGDEVEIFGKNIPVQDVAKWSGTIAYEVLTGVSQRVKRVYIEE